MTDIIDAHHHIWRRRDLPWLDGPMQPRIFGPYEPIRRDYLIDEYLADLAGTGVTQSVYVQCNWAKDRFEDEVAYVQRTADETGFPQAIVGYADFLANDVRPQLDRLTKYPGMRGLRTCIGTRCALSGASSSVARRLIGVIVLSAVIVVMIVVFAWFYFYSRTPAWGQSDTRKALLNMMIVVGPIFGMHYRREPPELPSISAPGPDDDGRLAGPDQSARAERVASAPWGGRSPPASSTWTES